MAIQVPKNQVNNVKFAYNEITKSPDQHQINMQNNCSTASSTCHKLEPQKHQINVQDDCSKIDNELLQLELLRHQINKEFKRILLVCHRCKTHLTCNKKTDLPKASWNNLQPRDIPEVIQVLLQAEQRLLARITPFLKVVKYDG